MSDEGRTRDAGRTARGGGATRERRRAGARRALAARFGVAALAGLAVVALSRVPVPGVGADRGWLRLSWRVVSDGAERCTPLSDAELERRPVHMRTDACEVLRPEYDLQVRVDGSLRHAERVRHAGARGDRPAYVFAEIATEPGVHDVDVRFRASLPDTVGGRDSDLSWSGTLTLEPGQVWLITLAEGRLEAVRTSR